MPNRQDITTVLCLFHTREQTQQVLADLQNSNVPAGSISVIDGSRTSSYATRPSVAAWQQLSLPERDRRMLSDGLDAGGTIIFVSGPEAYTDTAEDIFSRHRAAQVDEKVISEDTGRKAAALAVADAAVIPVVEEELVVGKRQVQRGGVRVYSRLVETPIEEKVTLQEEHAVIDRRPVNRLVTEADLEKLRSQSIEVTESEEVPVVEKSARVVEEVLVSKETTQRTERVADTVRRTEVEIEPVEATEASNTKPKGRKKSS